MLTVMPSRVRLDAELVRRGLARSREQAAELISSGRVAVAGLTAGKPAPQVGRDAPITVSEGTGPDYVSPGGHTLSGALAPFGHPVGLAPGGAGVGRCAGPARDLVLVGKPQCGVGKGRVGPGGVVRVPGLRAEAVSGVAQAAAARGLGVAGLTASPLPGPAGNVEYFLWLRRAAPPLDAGELERAIADGPQ